MDFHPHHATANTIGPSAKTISSVRRRYRMGLT